MLLAFHRFTLLCVLGKIFRSFVMFTTRANTSASFKMRLCTTDANNLLVVLSTPPKLGISLATVQVVLCAFASISRCGVKVNLLLYGRIPRYFTEFFLCFCYASLNLKVFSLGLSNCFLLSRWTPFLMRRVVCDIH